MSGLNTYEALSVLLEEINEKVNNHENTYFKSQNCFNGFISIIIEVIRHKSKTTHFRISSLLIIVIQIAFLLAAANFCDEKRSTAIFGASFIIFATIFNTVFAFYETTLRKKEIFHLIRNVVSDMLEHTSSTKWTTDNYPHLHSPPSPCISLQWTKRDGCIVNLPWTLLVKGDVIVLKPGQRVPGKCQSLQNGSQVLNGGDTYAVLVDGAKDGLNSPKARQPLQESPFLLLETPYLNNLQVLLQESDKRPITIFNKQGYLMFGIIMEFVLAPLCAILAIILGVLRLSHYEIMDHWAEVIFIIPVSITLPLVPLLVPVVWTELNWLGTARLITLYNREKSKEAPILTGTIGDSEIQPLHDWDLDKHDIKEVFFKLITGKQQIPVRTANLIHVLASITNLCCIDKKGILSWPNPSAEKLFFLRKKKKENSLPKPNTFASNPSIFAEEEIIHFAEKSHEINESDVSLMTLTHNPMSAFGLQFDDPTWKQYLMSLKPLGLNILLNTCNPLTQKNYTQFCSYIACEAIYNDDLIPVSQRRCLCELAKQMGFTSGAPKPFNLEHQLFSFRHEPPDMICRDLVKSLMTSKLKFPFPHMVSVLMRDMSSGKLELMSQGTGDIILESCTDYWDGSDITPLTEKERKKILDFYHRTSLSAYCTSFAYRPTACKIKDEISRFYLELPIDPANLYQSAATPTPHISTEALFGDVDHSEYEEISDAEDSLRLQSKQIFIGMIGMQYQAKIDMVHMIEQLDDACIRFVHFSKENELRSKVFSEKMGLECGWNCHISLLSDKNRAESSISGRASNSVLSKSQGYALSDPHFGEIGQQNKLNRGLFDSSRNLSYSAPSAINLEMNQVKFEEEVSVWSGSKVNQFFDADSQQNWENGDGHPSNECLILIDGEPENTSINGHSQKIQGGQQSRTASQSLSVSHMSSSSGSASLNLYDLSNRAKLPKGIENIRPHLKNVDNVPLLVSLFTDCTTPTTGTMLQIMQENGEVTVLMGSTSSAENMDLFMLADLCLGVEPLYPQVCMQEPAFTLPKNVEIPSPSEVARKLNSIPCSLSFHRDDTISITNLILESRHYMQCFMNCFQFWASCCVSVSAIQLCSSCSLLPPILSLVDVLWLVVVPIPLLSISLQFAPLNHNVMNEATGKNKLEINRQTLKYVLVYYVSKFLPSLSVVFLVFLVLINNVCSIFQQHFSCDYIYPIFSSNSSYLEDIKENFSSSIYLTQKFAAFQLVLYFAFISISFVHKMYPLWEKSPHSNKYWIAFFFLAILCQSVYTTVCVVSVKNNHIFEYNIYSIPEWLWSIYFLWPFILLIINELIKKTEIRVNVRYQKRARLEFGTKLGMNSPF